VIIVDSAADVRTSSDAVLQSAVTLPQQSLVVSTQHDNVGSAQSDSVGIHDNDVSKPSDAVVSEARTSEQDSPHHVEDSPHHVACTPQPPSTVDTDVDSGARTDSRYVQDDNFDVHSIDANLDASVYHDCISASFVGKLMLYNTRILLFSGS